MVSLNLNNLARGANPPRRFEHKALANYSPAHLIKVNKHISKTITDPFIKGVASGLKRKSLKHEFFGRLQDISLGLERMDDSVIREKIYNQKGGFFLNFAEQLLDAYHCANQNYSSRDGRVNKYYNYLKKEVDKKAADVVANKSTVLGRFLNKLGFNKPTEENLQLKASFDKARKWESLSTFCSRYSGEKPDVANHLYEKYYLPTLSAEAKEACKKVSDEFGTKIFLENDDNYRAPIAVYKELSEWKKAGSSEVLYPGAVDFSQVNQKYIDKDFAAGGAFNYLCDSKKFLSNWIIQPGDSLDVIAHALRHEMSHLNDKKFIYKVNYPSPLRELKRGKSFEAELINAGVDNAGYAHKNTFEFVACAGTGDYSKYSNRLKNLLVRLGMPEWQFNMKPVKDMNYFDESPSN